MCDVCPPPTTSYVAGCFWRFYVNLRQLEALPKLTERRGHTMVQERHNRSTVSGFQGTDRDGIYGRIGKKGSIDQMQRSDAVHMLQEDHAWRKGGVVRMKGNLWRFLSLGLALVLSFVPSPAHKQAQQRHAIGRSPGKRKKKSKVMDALKQTDTSSMTKRTKKPCGNDTVTGLIAKKCSRQIRSRHWHLPGQKLSYKKKYGRGGTEFPERADVLSVPKISR